jgi:hypothetical protein
MRTVPSSDDESKRLVRRGTLRRVTADVCSSRLRAGDMKMGLMLS